MQRIWVRGSKINVQCYDKVVCPVEENFFEFITIFYYYEFIYNSVAVSEKWYSLHIGDRSSQKSWRILSVKQDVGWSELLRKDEGPWNYRHPRCVFLVTSGGHFIFIIYLFYRVYIRSELEQTCLLWASWVSRNWAQRRGRHSSNTNPQHKQKEGEQKKLEEETHLLQLRKQNRQRLKKK